MKGGVLRSIHTPKPDNSNDGKLTSGSKKKDTDKDTDKDRDKDNENDPNKVATKEDPDADGNVGSLKPSQCEAREIGIDTFKLNHFKLTS